MPYALRARAVRRAVLCTLATGCHTWQARPIPPDASPTVSRDRPVRVWRADRSTLELVHPQIEHDSLVGDAGTPPTRTAVALTDIRRIEERRVSGVRTGGLVLGGAATALIVLLGAAAAAALIAFSHSG